MCTRMHITMAKPYIPYIPYIHVGEGRAGAARVSKMLRQAKVQATPDACASSYGPLVQAHASKLLTNANLPATPRRACVSTAQPASRARARAREGAERN